MKHLVELKLNINQKIYVVFGEPAEQTILSAKVHSISIDRGGITYAYDNIKLIKSKKKLKEEIFVGTVEEQYVDIGNAEKPLNCFASHNWPVFTSKELCINYLRRFKNG